MQINGVALSRNSLPRYLRIIDFSSLARPFPDALGSLEERPRDSENSAGGGSPRLTSDKREMAERFPMDPNVRGTQPVQVLGTQRPYCNGHKGTVLCSYPPALS